MRIDTRYLPPPVPSTTDQPQDVTAALVSEFVRDRMLMISSGTPRSRQAHLGPSEIGQACPRRLGYRIAGTPIVNLPDPLKAMFGTGLHEVLAQGFTRLADPARYLIEHEVTYRSVTGRVDLFDRARGWAIDWKTTTVGRIKQYRRDGPPTNYVVQASIYAAGLAAQGEQVSIIALVFIPRDGSLKDVWTWTTEPDVAVADVAIDRYDGLVIKTNEDGPAALSAQPSNLCGYCPNHRKGSVDLSVACPGKDAP